jgi:hypothetical protein
LEGTTSSNNPSLNIWTTGGFITPPKTTDQSKWKSLSAVPDLTAGNSSLAKAESDESSDDLGLLIASILAMIVLSALFSYLLYMEGQRKHMEIERRKMAKQAKKSQKEKKPQGQ